MSTGHSGTVEERLDIDYNEDAEDPEFETLERQERLSSTEFDALVSPTATTGSCSFTILATAERPHSSPPLIYARHEAGTEREQLVCSANEGTGLPFSLAAETSVDISDVNRQSVTAAYVSESIEFDNGNAENDGHEEKDLACKKEPNDQEEIGLGEKTDLTPVSDSLQQHYENGHDDSVDVEAYRSQLSELTEEIQALSGKGIKEEVVETGEDEREATENEGEADDDEEFASDDDDGSVGSESGTTDSSRSSESESGEEKSSIAGETSSSEPKGSASVSKDKLKSEVGAISNKGKRTSSVSDPAAKKPKLKVCGKEPKLDFFYRDARFFLIKSGNKENVSLSKAKGLWATTPRNEQALNRHFRETRNVILIFSVEKSQAFQGFCRMASEGCRDSDPVQWVLPHGMSARSLGAPFKVQWLSRCELPFIQTMKVFNALNEGKPVKIGRDGQEVDEKSAKALCDMFPLDAGIDFDGLIDKVKKTHEGHQRFRSDEKRAPVSSGASRSGASVPFQRGGRPPRGAHNVHHSNEYRYGGVSRDTIMNGSYYDYINEYSMAPPPAPYGYPAYPPMPPPPGMYDYSGAYAYGGNPYAAVMTGANSAPVVPRDKYETRVAAFLSKTERRSGEVRKRRHSGEKRTSHASPSSSRRRNSETERQHRSDDRRDKHAKSSRSSGHRSSRHYDHSPAPSRRRHY